jgi:hypothetical protein
MEANTVLKILGELGVPIPPIGADAQSTLEHILQLFANRPEAFACRLARLYLASDVIRDQLPPVRLGSMRVELHAGAARVILTAADYFHRPFEAVQSRQDHQTGVRSSRNISPPATPGHLLSGRDVG